MTDSPPRREKPALSPLVQLLPTGYRGIQPLQKGGGWRANGAARHHHHHHHHREPSSVVFPALASSESQLMHGADDEERQEREDDEIQLHGPRAPPTTLSPSSAAIPVPPSAPRRPSKGDGNQQSGGPLTASPSFRTRAIAAAAATAITTVAASNSYSNGPLHSCAVAYDEIPANGAKESEDDAKAPDPEVVAQLWQEYAERTKPKTIDKDTYHRKMQRKYTETKALRERVSRLESELAVARRERDEALDVAARSVQRSVEGAWEVSESSEENFPTHQSPSESAPGTGMSVLEALQKLTALEASYRVKVFELERTLAATKDAMVESHARLAQQHEEDRAMISTLTAKLVLEQEASQKLAKQLHEANAAFKCAADELASTQIEFEREQIHKKIVLEQIQQQTNQLLSDHRRKELQNRVKNVVQKLGKEALHQKMEALHTRALVAEQNMRKAQLQVSNLEAECEAQQLQLEQILSSSALKYHSLASDGGVPGILQRATPLFYGTKVVTGQFLLVQILYEDERVPTAKQSRHDSPASVDAFGNDAFRMHFVCYEAQTAQDDFLTFQLRDIQRLVPDHENYLARFTNRKRERLTELAEILIARIHAGYKNGHLVITEIPMTTPQGITGGNNGSERREVSLLRTTRRLTLSEPENNFKGMASGVLTEILVNEVYEASTSELWWLEIRALILDVDGSQNCGDDCCGAELSLTVDCQLLLGICPHLGSYRPSESVATSRRSNGDENEMFGIHEELLEPLLSKLTVVANRHANDNQAKNENVVNLKLTLANTSTSATLTNQDDVSSPSRLDNTGIAKQDNEEFQSIVDIRREQPFWNQDDATESVLDHRCIVRVADSFYCTRIQEIWDVELMLDITMEEPETQSRFRLVIPESDIVAIARHLFAIGSADKDYSLQVKNGLPSALHVPVCRLLKKHLQPVAVGQERTSSVRAISIASLINEIDPPSPPDHSCITSNITSKWKTLQPLESDFPEYHIFEAAAELSEQESDQVSVSPSPSLHRIRRGYRIRSTQPGACYAIVDIWSGFRHFPGLVLEISPILDRKSASTTTSSPPSLVEGDLTKRVATLQSLDDVLEVLDVRRPCQSTLDRLGVE